MVLNTLSGLGGDWMEIEGVLRKMVGIESVFPNEGRMGSFLEDYLKEHGFEVRRQYISEGRFNLLAEKGKGKRPALFLAHMDTVPVASGWKTDPFSLIEKEGMLYGLGAYDMKGGIAAVLAAAESMRGSKVKLLLCADEENISKGAWAAVRKESAWLNDASIIVSPEPPMNIGEKASGVTAVTVGRGGRSVICVDVKGRAAHQGNRAAGVSAIKEAATIMASIEKMQLRSESRLGSDEVFVRAMHGESKGLSLPEAAHFEIDMRIVPPGTTEDGRTRVERFVKKLQESGEVDGRAEVVVSVKERETPFLQPYITDIRAPQVRKVLDIIRDGFGKPEIAYGSSVSDENVLANELDVPVIKIGPEGEGAHSANECVSKQSLDDLAELFSRIIERFG